MERLDTPESTRHRPSTLGCLLPTLAIALASVATGCRSHPSVPENPSKVEIERVAPDGKTTPEPAGKDAQKVTACLKTSTKVGLDQVAKQVLDEGKYRIRVSDGAVPSNTKNYELINTQNITDDAGNYYENHCLYDIIQKAR